MKQYIDKSELLEELKRCEKICEDYMLSHKDVVSQGIANAKRAMCQHIIKIINTLETKEVDLEKEIKRFTMSKELYESDSVIKAVAEHFYELGMQKSKGE